MRKDWDADKLTMLNALNPYSNKGYARMVIHVPFTLLSSIRTSRALPACYSIYKAFPLLLSTAERCARSLFVPDGVLSGICEAAVPVLDEKGNTCTYEVGLSFVLK